MTQITETLLLARDGDPTKLGEVFAAVYPELKRLARNKVRYQPVGSSVTTTAIVHETYLRLVQSDVLTLKDREHFFACAARAMRLIMIDHLRASNADKRGGGLDPITLPPGLGHEIRTSYLSDLDRALDGLEEIDPPLRELVELKYYAGLTHREIAELRECSEKTIQRDWRRARAFLYSQLNP